jgi:hypothetical protein
MDKKLVQLKEQFFGKVFWGVLLGLAIAFGLSALVFQTVGQQAALIMIGLTVFVVALWDLKWGLVIAFAELFANSHGRLISADLFGTDVSLRMIVFVAVLAAWVVLLLMKRAKLSLSDRRWSAFVPLGLAIILAFIIGSVSERPFTNVFNDGNGYLYLAYLGPLLSVAWTQANKRILLQTLAASATWVGLLTYGIVYIFSHFPEGVLGGVYEFVRDTRTAEVTKMQEGVYRVFLQAQLSVMVILLILFACYWFLQSKWSERKLMIPALAFFSGVVIVSMSRSFWVGAIAAALVFVGLYTQRPNRPVSILENIGWTFLAKLGAFLLILAVISFPIPSGTGSLSSYSDTVSKRASQSEDVAVASRWNLLNPMWATISEKPVSGHGFGKIVAYDSDDPRAEKQGSETVWRTFAFEWGWMDVWLKMGIPGLVGFGWLFYILARDLFEQISEPGGWLSIGLLSGIVLVYATHMFSPYLNHPLGLGVLLFTVPFMSRPKLANAEPALDDKSTQSLKNAETAILQN